MNWILGGITTILSCELFCRIPIIHSVLQIKLIASKAARVLKSKAISDHWKERILPKYAFGISKYSILSFLYLVIAVCPFLVVGLLSSFIGLNFFSFISKPLPIASITLFAWIYLALRKDWGYLLNRKKKPSTSKYNFTSKLLHHLALNSNIRCEILFDIEKAKFSSVTETSTEGHHVFVCGLARSGTTVLMRALYQSGQFSSLTYRDMPFVLAPNLWSKLTSKNRKSIQKETRAHDDGVLVDYDSPEALDEVFWRVFAGKDYIHSDCLTPHEINDDLKASFRDYIGVINSRYSKNRYLSKNNNNILRLRGITDSFPNAIVLIPFREPLQHAFSLFKQHKNFVSQHSEDTFSEKYMSWLVHHEFGLAHRPFKFSDDTNPPKDINTLDYWLYQWVNTYSYLLERTKEFKNRIFFICYEDICHKDRAAWKKISELTNIPLGNDVDFILKTAITPTPANDNLSKKASEIYCELLTDSRERIGLPAKGVNAPIEVGMG